MLDFIGTVALVTAIIVTSALLVGATKAAPRARLGIAIGVGAWIGVAVALGAAGEYSDAGRRAFPLVGSMFAAPLVAASLLALFVPAARTAFGSLPTSLLVGLNAWRIFGGLFVLLAVDGRLGGPFPQFAGWGDVITGVLALPVAWLAARPATAPRLRLVAIWNAFGALDLVVAVTLGIVSTNGGPLQLIAAGAGSAAMQHLPWSVVPTVLVPAYLIMHWALYMNLRRASQAFLPASIGLALTR